MKSVRRLVAIDCDLRTVRAVVARGRGNHLRVERWGEEPLSESGALKDAIARLVTGMEIQGASAVIVLPRRLFLERVLSVPGVSRRNQSAVVSQELNSVLPWSEDQRLDTTVPLPSLPGNSLTRLVAFSAQSEVVQTLVDACLGSGLKVLGTVPVGLALANAFQSSGQGSGVTLGARDEADLIYLGGAGWEFSRAFPWDVAPDQLRRSLEFVSVSGSRAAEVRVPEGLELPALDDSPRITSWRPVGTGELPPAFWAAWGALRVAGSNPTAGVLRMKAESEHQSLLKDPRNQRAMAVLVAGLLGLTGVLGYRWQQHREAGVLARKEAQDEAELAAWRVVPFPIARRLETLDALGKALTDGIRVTSLCVEGDRLAELSAVAPSATEVISALEQSKSLARVALLGPVIRRGAAEGEVFSISGRLLGAGNVKHGDTAPNLRAVQQIALAWVPGEQVPNRLLSLAEEAARQADVELQSKSAQVVPSPQGREHFGVDLSLNTDGKRLGAFLHLLADRVPLLSLDGLSAYKTSTDDGFVFRLQLSLDRPTGRTVQTKHQGSARPDVELARLSGLIVPRDRGYPGLEAGRLFGKILEPAKPRIAEPQAPVTPKVALQVEPQAADPAPPPPPLPVPPPPPPKSGLAVLGIVHDEARPHALLRPLAGGSSVVVKPGDKVGEEEIVEVRRDRVIVRVKDTLLELLLPGPTKQ